MLPVEVVHLYLHEVPMILLVMVQQPVEGSHVAMIRESQMLDTSGLALLEQEIEDAVVEETSLQRVHATSDAMQQIVVDMVHFQTLHRLLIHALRGIETPSILTLIRHFRGHIVFISRMT